MTLSFYIYLISRQCTSNQDLERPRRRLHCRHRSNYKILIIWLCMCILADNSCGWVDNCAWKCVSGASFQWVHNQFCIYILTMTLKIRSTQTTRPSHPSSILFAGLEILRIRFLEWRRRGGSARCRWPPRRRRWRRRSRTGWWTAPPPQSSPG